jgi:hypothetical protein
MKMAAQAKFEAVRRNGRVRLGIDTLATYARLSVCVYSYSEPRATPTTSPAENSKLAKVYA